MRHNATKYSPLTEVLRSLWSLVPSGGSLPEEVWRKRHRFLSGLTWLHALIIALVGPVFGYSWELSFEALLRDGTVLHTADEGLIVAFFALLAGWSKASREFRATTVAFGLMSSSAILVHLSGGYIELHFHFFVMLVFLALYQDWVPYLLAIVYVALHHGTVGVLWPQAVYNHPAAFNAPWTWAGIHAFFVLWSCVGSVIAWRFNETAYEKMKNLAEALEKSNKIKDEFLSVMSHELRTPLNVVVGYTQMIKDGSLGKITPEQEEALEKVISRASDQLALVNDILYATVLETEQVRIDSHEVSLENLLNRLKEVFDVPINKELTLNWDYPPELPVVKTDGAKLKQILQNLINNAVKFTDKGSVTISARIGQPAEGNGQQEKERQQASDNGHRWVELKVADTGAGIPKEHLPFIFDKFRQADSSETRLYGGVGLGLYIVRQFTELLGGKVEVESEIGKGSEFTVTIPLEN